MNTDKIYAESIANEYSVKDTSKVIALKKLDHKAKSPAKIFGYSFGTFSTLVFGTGMCLAMRVIGEGNIMFILGIIIGLVGFGLMGLNYLIYKKILESGKKKYAADIVALAKEITESESNK